MGRVVSRKNADPGAQVEQVSAVPEQVWQFAVQGAQTPSGSFGT